MIRGLRYTSGLDKVDAAIALPDPSSTLTVEAWFYVATLGANERPIIWIKTPAGGTVALLSVTGNTLTFAVTDLAGAIRTKSATITTHLTCHIMATWQRYAVPYTRLRLYQDATLVGSLNSPDPQTVLASSESPFPVQIGGATGDVLTTGFAGWIGWVRISKNIRSASATNLDGTAPAIDSNTLGQWNMSEGTGTVLDDAVGVASHDGTITGARWSYLPQTIRHLTVGPRSGPA